MPEKGKEGIEIMRIHLHEKINATGKTSHYDHRNVESVAIDADGFIEITHYDKECSGTYTYKIEDFRRISIRQGD